MSEILLAVSILVFQAPPAKPDITQEQALELARRIEKDHADGNHKGFDDLLDIEGLLDIHSADLELTPKEKSDFLERCRKGSLGQNIGTAQGYTLHFLKVRVVDGKTMLRFRLWSTGITYIDLEVKNTASGLRIADLFWFSTGEWHRTFIRRVLMAVSASDPKRRAKMPEWATDWMKNMVKLNEFVQEGQAGSAEKALTLFAGFPESMKKDRMIQTIRMVAACRVGDAEYLMATADYLKHFPDDGYRDIPCLGALILRQEYAKLHESIDRIDRLVEGDSLLDLIRGRVHLLEEKPAPARERGEKAITALPEVVETHWFMVKVCLAEKKHAETVERLQAVEKKFRLEMQFTVIEAEPVYAEFAKSPEYLAWKKSRAPK